jgi:hypothetical protein
VTFGYNFIGVLLLVDYIEGIIIQLPWMKDKRVWFVKETGFS